MLERAGTTCLQGRSSGAWYDNRNEPTSVLFSKALLQNINNNQPRGTLICKNGGAPNNVPGVIDTTGAVWIDSILADSKTVITTNAQATSHTMANTCYFHGESAIIDIIPTTTNTGRNRLVCKMKWNTVAKFMHKKRGISST
jgi:hypothetical protein